MKRFLKQKNIFICLFLILLLGGFLRIYKLGLQSFTGDEFFDINSIYGYAQTEKWQAWDFNIGALEKDPSISQAVKNARDTKSWIYRWQVVQLFRWMPATEAVARSVSVSWGIISILLLYFSAKYFTKKKSIGLICAFLFAINISAIELDRTLRMYAMFFPIFLLFSWLFYLFLEEKYTGKIDFIQKAQKKFDINLFWLVPALLAGTIKSSSPPIDAKHHSSNSSLLFYPIHPRFSGKKIMAK